MVEEHSLKRNRSRREMVKTLGAGVGGLSLVQTVAGELPDSDDETCPDGCGGGGSYPIPISTESDQKQNSSITEGQLHDALLLYEAYSPFNNDWHIPLKLSSHAITYRQSDSSNNVKRVS
ncbi:hypothetical protein [Haloarchaeobius iranensis]|uniref:hypothetical protein n=1 Tax=Haloarchaeobius iranensis TaxID=996166 RepID=UPI0011133A65|nr:hypothetical protein [Haloarchaeobius iranensis]